MRPFTLLLLTVFFRLSAGSQLATMHRVIQSEQFGDNYDIYISISPKNYAGKKYDVVYYLDANLRSGKKLREYLHKWTDQPHLDNYIFVGISHHNNYRKYRARDLIQPIISNSDTFSRKKYGNADKFRLFLDDIIQKIDSEFITNKDNSSILGHSLGGSFAFYCLFQNDPKFSNFYALSPALWVRNYSIYSFNKLGPGPDTKKYLYFSSGSREDFNKILSGAKQVKKFFDQQKYRNLTYEFEIWKGKDHNSAVPATLEKILKEKLKQRN